MLLMIFLIVLSVCSTVLNNVLCNHVGKKYSERSDMVKRFQFFAFLSCFVVFVVLACFESFSLYTVLVGVLFGVVAFLSTHFCILAMSSGPMHITVLVVTASMLIPTLSGCLFFGEPFSIFKLIAALILVVFLYLASAAEKGKKINVKWLIYCSIAFLAGGIIGVLQKVHQSSTHSDEFYLFLASAFLVATLFAMFNKKQENQSVEKISIKFLGISLLSGACVFAMYVINTKLSGQLPSQLFFPLINGSNVVISSLLSFTVFKEKMSVKQLVGIAGGLLCLIAICVLP